MLENPSSGGASLILYNGYQWQRNRINNYITEWKRRHYTQNLYKFQIRKFCFLQFRFHFIAWQPDDDITENMRCNNQLVNVVIPFYWFENKHFSFHLDFVFFLFFALLRTDTGSEWSWYNSIASSELWIEHI